MRPFEQRGSAVIKRLPRGGKAAEVGVLMGVMSEFMLRQRPDISLLMVDNWLTADKQPARYKATGDVHAHHDDPSMVADHRRQAENRARHFPGRATILAMNSVRAAKEVEDGSLDLVFLDADHSKQGVLADIKAWLPKIRPGGWIGGHDYGNDNAGFQFGVTEAVDEWAARSGAKIETDLNFTWFARV